MSALDAEETLREQYAKLYTAVNNTNHGLALFGADGCIVVCNDLYAHIYRLAPNQVRPGTPARRITNLRAVKGIDIPEAILDEAYEADGIHLKSSTSLHKLPDGRRVQVTCQPLWDGGWVSVHEDVTERIMLEERLAQLAHYDELTGLANRTRLLERLQSELSSDAADLFVFLIDLDSFKHANDAYGHAFGDGVLKTVAQRMQHCVRPTDFIARLGGDEFVMLRSGTSDPGDAARLAQQINEALRVPIQFKGRTVAIGGSIGIATGSEEAQDVDVLLNQADLAMYQAKDAGGNTYCFFEPEMERAAKTRWQLEAELRKAAASCDDFEVHYQPLVDIAKEQVVGCEALLRWTHPTLGRVGPDQFIPIAEETGLMDVLGDYVMTRACMDAANWPENIKVSVNVSAAQITNNTVGPAVRSALAKSGLAASRLQIEITETTLMKSLEKNLRVLEDLRAIGVDLVMDDFGTGYSSLGYLRTFPFDKIKIDRSFAQGLETDRGAEAIMAAICALGRSLDVSTTAEGIETREQLDIIRSLGCTEFQGYLFSEPLPNAELQEILLTKTQARVATAA
jgi:diguanylate cyclase (GGDEF)-like protein